jgi:hypothetical protein
VTATTIDFERKFGERRAYCRALAELSLQQPQLVREDRTADLVELLKHKQQLINELLDLTNGEHELRDEWRSRRSHIDPTVRVRCETILNETERLLAAILKVEQDVTTTLIQKQEETRRELQAISASGAAHHAYHAEEEGAVSRFRVDL